MVKTSTEYYRENKTTRNRVHMCPQCDYETTGPMCVLRNHIAAKHTPEHLRPFQCTECKSGFAQKAHLIKHLKRAHDMVDPKLMPKSTAILYIIVCTDTMPKSYKTRARIEYYKQNPHLKSTDMQQRKYRYYNDIYIKNRDINYDYRNGFIKLYKLPLVISN